jgi:hypothetical protein
MNWYNFEKKYPRVFSDFQEWFARHHKEEFAKCSAPVYDLGRLIEYFKLKGFSIETIQGDGSANFIWHVNTGNEMRQGFASEHDAQHAGIYLAFEQGEKKFV